MVNGVCLQGGECLMSWTYLELESGLKLLWVWVCGCVGVCVYEV